MPTPQYCARTNHIRRLPPAANMEKPTIEELRTIRLALRLFLLRVEEYADYYERHEMTDAAKEERETAAETENLIAKVERLIKAEKQKEE